MARSTDDAARETLAALIETEPDRLRRRSISLGVPIVDAEDAAQTSLLRAWRSVAHLDAPEPGRVCAWLDAIARNVAIDLARQRARRPQAELDDDIAGEQAGVVDEVEIRVFLDGALQALHALPDTLREPLLLSVVEGLPAEAVARRLGITPAAARQRISRARKELNACRSAGMEES
ncbi:MULTISPECIES: RNA polymerase sigma factor [unclassified Microbacterium]|uniref:RNA polymerase sigma factor n=1 Tax=unclassified Microbacterium TaxID=2609290 RepID=UPI0030193866